MLRARGSAASRAWWRLTEVDESVLWRITGQRPRFYAGGMLIVEKFYLLMKKDDGRSEAGSSMAAYGMNAAVITDLVLAGRVAISDEKKPRLKVLSAEPTGHPAMDHALNWLQHKDGKKLDSLVTSGSLDPQEPVVDSLVGQRVLQRGEGGFLGLGRYRHPVLNPEPERLLRAALAEVIAGRKRPDIGETTLLAILEGMNATRWILKEETHGMRPKEVKQAIGQIVEDSAVGSSVERMVKSMNAAMMAAMILPVVVAGSGG